MPEFTNSIDQSFSKDYKICSTKEIEALYKTGFSIHKFPFSYKIAIQSRPKPRPFQVVVSVPKRRFKKAVDRNLLKRRTTEGIRKNKTALESFLTKNNIQLSILIVYANNKSLTYQEIEKQLIKGLKSIEEIIQNEKNTIPTL